MFEDVFVKSIGFQNVIYILIVALVFIFLRKFVVRSLLKLLINIAERFNRKNISLAIESIEKSLNNILLVTAIYIALLMLPFNYTVVVVMINKIYSILVIAIVGSGLLKLLDTYSHIIMQNTEFFDKKPVMRTLFPLIVKGAKLLVVLIIIVIVSAKLGFEEIKSLLAGVGIGGLAVAMAAQDLLKNIFGGFVILTDRSFNTGDFIKIENNEGVVEEVGIRSTKVRTLEQELIVVPNSKFVDGSVLNYSKRGTRRVKQVIGATYSTNSTQLKHIIERLKDYLNSQSMVVNGTVNINFDGFGGSSLDILVLYRINTSDYNEYLKFKEIVNFEIMKIFEEEKAEFAFPSLSVYMEK